MAIKTRSRKAKGRRLQQKIREDLRNVGKDYDILPEDIESRQMGGAGVDVILSAAAKKIFPFDIECKNCEALNVWATFWKHYGMYEGTNNTKLLVHSKNNSEPIVVLRWQDYLKLYDLYLNFKKIYNETL